MSFQDPSRIKFKSFTANNTSCTVTRDGNEVGLREGEKSVTRYRTFPTVRAAKEFMNRPDVRVFSA